MAFIGSSGGIDTATLPAHQAGDLIVVWAFSRSTGLPVIPAGFIPVLQVSADSFAVAAAKYATSSSDTIGTWTNSTSLTVNVYRSGGLLTIGSSTSNSDFGTLINYPSLTLENTDNTSIVAAFLGHRSYNIDTSQTPNGTVLRESYAQDFVSVSASYDTDTPVSTWSDVDVEVGGSASFWVSGVVEIKELSSSVTIDDVTDPLNTNAQSTINGSGFEAAQGVGTVEQLQGLNSTALIIDTWSDTQLVVNSMDIESSAYFYGTQSIMVTANGGDSALLDFESVPLVNNDFVNITSLATEGDRLTAIPDLSVGDQVRYQSVLYLLGVPTVYTVVVNDDATFSVDGSTPSGSYTFDVRAYDSSDNTWGTVGVQSVDIVGTGSTINITMTGIPDGNYLTRIFREDTGAIVINDTISYSSGAASALLSGVPVSTQTTSFVIDGSPTPLIYGADNGVTE